MILGRGQLDIKKTGSILALSMIESQSKEIPYSLISSPEGKDPQAPLAADKKKAETTAVRADSGWLGELCQVMCVEPKVELGKTMLVHCGARQKISELPVYFPHQICAFCSC